MAGEKLDSNAAPRARRSSLGPALPRSFYARDTRLAARDLLGAILVCDVGGQRSAGRIVETEAYVGEHDGACHAAAGLTARTAPLYGAPGTAYVYRIYGMHWCFNAVTRDVGEPGAVLVRAVEPIAGLDLMLARRNRVRRISDVTNGPGKLCAALGIDSSVNSLPLVTGDLRIHRGKGVNDGQVTVTPRIGVTRAADWPLRYFITSNPFVSRTPRRFPAWRFGEQPTFG